MAVKTAVSAPGKVLLAGGYLVLDRRHTGLVFGLDARIHVLVEARTDEDIVVESPQFKDAVWTYHWGQDRCLQERSVQQNPFVRTALQYALSYLETSTKPDRTSAPFTLTILADNDYYSQSAEDSADTRDQFHKFNKPIHKVNKTGLGSSAALVTAVTGAVLSYYNLKTQSNPTMSTINQETLHRLAQAAHCAAQGKVGSGFDVASAVFGSLVYRRFSPSLLHDLGVVDHPEFGERLTELIDADNKWDHEVNVARKVAIPPGLRLVMCDVNGGSQTPGMVKQVLSWRAQNANEADALWTELQKFNDELADQMVGLSNSSRCNDLKPLRTCFQEIRRLIRAMSSATGVPIEPEQQTRLLDACSSLKGVVGGVVPGAGGYDAIALLIEDDDEVSRQLTSLLDGWKFQDGGGTVKLLGVRGEMEGFRVEDVEQYKSWI